MIKTAWAVQEDISEILISADDIQRRVGELGQAVSHDFPRGRARANHDDGAIHQDPDGDGDARQRHDVDRDAEEVEGDEGQEHRYRDRDDRHHGRLATAHRHGRADDILEQLAQRFAGRRHRSGPFQLPGRPEQTHPRTFSGDLLPTRLPASPAGPAGAGDESHRREPAGLRCGCL